MDKKALAKEMVRIATDILAAGDTDQVNDGEGFKRYVEENLYDTLGYIGQWEGMDAYNADTNGNDVYYAMHIFVNDKGVYYSDASLTEDDIERDGEENCMPEVDDFYNYRFSEFPVDMKAFKKWLDRRIERGIDDGIEAFDNYNKGKDAEDPSDAFQKQLDELPIGQSIKGANGKDIFKLEIPDWALPYLVNGDSSGLDDDDIEMIDDWYKRNNVEYVETTDETNEFTAYPEFGEACATTVCYVGIRG